VTSYNCSIVTAIKLNVNKTLAAWRSCCYCTFYTHITFTKVTQHLSRPPCFYYCMQ